MSEKRIWQKPGAVLAALLGLFVLLQFFVPLRTAVKIGADEDWELSKATLALNGYHFYTEVWNDQPLLHTFIIGQVLKHISPAVLGPRLVTSGFAMLLLASVFLICLRVSGLVVATIATGLLIASPGFLELSSSCMVEIPALAPAVAGLACLMLTLNHGSLGERLEKIGVTGNLTRSSPSPQPSPLGRGSQLGRAPKGEGSTPHPALSPIEAEREKSGRARVAGLIVAGVLFGISFQIKFINIVLLPLVVLILWLRSRSGHPNPVQHEGHLTPALSPARGGSRPSEAESDRKAPPHPNPSPPAERGERNALSPATSWFVHSVLIFAAGLAVTFLAITFAMGAEGYWLQLKQSWAAHFASTKSFEYGSPSDHPFEWSILLKNWDTTLPVILGIIVCLRQVRRNALLIIPVAWFVLTLVVFGIHKPWWSYYYVHNAVPLCWCAAIGIEAVVKQWARGDARPPWFAVGTAAAGLCAAGIAVWMGARVCLQISKIRSSPQIYSSLVIKEVERYNQFTKFIYTDEPAYSFHTGIPMPPSLAVLTLKRLWSGDMTNARIVEELRTSQPGVLLLKNQTQELPFSDWMNAEYRLVYQDGRHNLYAHKSIVGKVKW